MRFVSKTICIYKILTYHYHYYVHCAFTSYLRSEIKIPYVHYKNKMFIYRTFFFVRKWKWNEKNKNNYALCVLLFLKYIFLVSVNIVIYTKFNFISLIIFFRYMLNVLKTFILHIKYLHYVSCCVPRLFHITLDILLKRVLKTNKNEIIY